MLVAELKRLNESQKRVICKWRNGVRKYIKMLDSNYRAYLKNGLLFDKNSYPILYNYTVEQDKKLARYRLKIARKYLKVKYGVEI